MSRGARLAARLLPAAALAGAVLSIVPIGVWWADTDAGAVRGAWMTWGWGGLVVTGVAVLLVILSRGRIPEAILAGWRVLMAVPPGRFLLAAAITLGAFSILLSYVLFDGNPRSVDGFAQLFHAKMLLAGRAWVPPPPDIGHFAALHMILGPDRWYSQYPPGQLVVLAGGLAVGVWWLLQPLFGALLVWATHRVTVWMADEGTARFAVVLLCLSPFVVSVAGSELNLLPSAALAVAAAAFATFTGGARWAWASALTGAALGLLVAFRPLDAVAASVPAALIALLMARRRLRVFATVAAFGTLATLPSLVFNAATTGSWRVFGYAEAWGEGIGLGFHPTPWGIPLTWARAVGLTAGDLHQLNVYLLDLPVPVLLLVGIGYLTGRREMGVRDAVPFVAIAALMGLLFFYFHRDTFYGPRLIFTVVPWFLVLFARSAVLIRRCAPGFPRRASPGPAAATWIAVALVVGLVAIAPGRLRAYRSSAPVLNLHPDVEARRAGVQDAVVVLPDGWGSRLIARMWNLGVPMRRTGRVYAAIDACTLELTVGRAERDPMAAAGLQARLDSLVALDRPGSLAGLTDDPNLRLLPGVPLPPDCADEIMFDRRGFIAFTPFLYLNAPSLDGQVVWARDLRDANARLFARYPDRRYYRYAPPSPGAHPVFIPLSAAGDPLDVPGS